MSFKLIQLYKPLCERYQSHLIVNDHISIAIEEGVGLHIGWEDLQLYAEQSGYSLYDALQHIRSQMKFGTWLGLTVHTNIEIIEKVQDIVQYVGVGPIFPTRTKKDVKSVVGPHKLQEICMQSNVNIVAVGGIQESNILQIENSGAHFFAMCSDIFDVVDPYEKIQRIYSLMNRR